MFKSPLKYLSVVFLLLMLSSCGTGRHAVSRGKNVPDYNVATKPSEPQVKNDYKNIPGIRKAIISEAHSWLGTRYIYGGHTKKGTDCSGMVMEIYLKVMNLKLPRASWEQQQYCDNIHRNLLAPGDLVFFSPGGKHQVSHVGIYIGNNEIIHASPSRGVIISSLRENYFQRNYHSSGTIPQIGPGLETTEPERSVKTQNMDVVKEINLNELDKVLNQKTDSILSSFMD